MPRNFQHAHRDRDGTMGPVVVNRIPVVFSGKFGNLLPLRSSTMGLASDVVAIVVVVLIRQKVGPILDSTRVHDSGPRERQ